MAVSSPSEAPPLVLPVGLGPHRRADYLRLPDEPRCELLYGRFYVSPAPTVLHQVLVTLLGRLLDEIAQGSGGLALVAPVDVALADHSVVQPDLVYVGPARRAVTAERLEGAPDLVVEVLSKGTTRRDRGEKLRLYAESGVQEYWIIDAVERQVEFLVQRNGEFVVVVPSGREYRSPVLPEIRLDLLELWAAVDRRIGGS
jgi:Uma2 family endonuclease